jgi:hypothetical protein
VNNNNGAFMTDMVAVVENGKPAFYWADSGDGYVLRGVDQNNDGVIQDPEVVSFAKFGTTRTFSPQALSAVRVNNQTIVYVALSSTQPGLYRCVDTNGNGTTVGDPSETTLLIGLSTGLTVPGRTGPVALNGNRWERVRAIADLTGRITVYAYERGSAANTATVTIAADDFCYFSCEDQNGTAVNPRVFFNPSLVNQLPPNADIQSGVLPDLDIVPVSSATRTAIFNDWRHHDVVRFGGPGGQDVHYFTNEYGAGTTRTFGALNASSDDLHGIVLRGIDFNQDGDLQDAGEVTIFYNGSGATLRGVQPPSFLNRATNQPVTSIIDFNSGMCAAGGRVYFYYNNSGQDSVLEFDDQNSNGVVETGEVRMPFFTPMNPYPGVYHQTFGPYGLQVRVLTEGLVPGPFAAGIQPFGEGCTGSNGMNPVADARGGAPAVGNAQFTTRVSRLPVFGLGVHLLGLSNTTVFGVPLPLDLGIAGAPGCQLRVSLTVLSVSAAGANGIASFALPIPNDPTLVGGNLYSQWLSIDLAANPGGLVTSNALAIAIQ